MLNETQQFLARLAAADRAHQRESGASFLLRCVKYICGAILLAFILDVVLHLGAQWRLVILISVAGGVAAMAAYSAYLAFVRKNQLEFIARFLESRDPALGSRLINLLHLRSQAADASLPSLTRDMARQAVESYSAEFQSVPLEKIARTGEALRGARRAAWGMLAFALILAACFQITAVEWARFVDPFGDHPAYSFTHLEIVQPGAAGTNVLYGSGAVVHVKALGHHPSELFLTAFPAGHREQAVTLPMFEKEGAGYDQLVDNIRSDTIVYAHTKDHASESKQAHIGVVLTPQLKSAFVQITPPAYTGLKASEKPYAYKDVQALEGSEIRFRLQSNRPLREGALLVNQGDAPMQHITLKKTGENEVSGSFIASESGRAQFSVVDVDGLSSQGDHAGPVTVTHDLPPQITVANPERDCFVAMDFTLEAQIEASDDYGLSEIRVHRGLNGVYSPPKTITFTNIVRDWRDTTTFHFNELGIQPGDVITLFAEAIDTAPAPHLARSQTVRLTVISVDDYNNSIREENDMADAEAKYEDLNADLQELADAQKQLGEQIDALAKQAANAGTNAKARDQMVQQWDNLVAKQNELNEKLRQHAERMENFVRNDPVYDVETNLQQVLREEAKSVRSSEQANDATTRQLAQQSSPSNGARQLTSDMMDAMKKASDDQVKRLGGTHDQTEKEVVQRLEDMSQMQELQKDFSMFEALFRQQQELAAQSAAYNRPGQLEREDQLALKDLAEQENNVAGVLKELQSKLRDDASSAEKLFPKAAKSARDLADEMSRRRLAPLAGDATAKMLAADGEQSSAIAERLRSEMEKMCSQCQPGGNAPSPEELDSYLKLHQMSANKTFAQMGRSRKFGIGSGLEKASAEGKGSHGSKSYAMADGSPPSVLGNESSSRNGNKPSRQSSRYGKGPGQVASTPIGTAEKPDTLKSLNPINRQSGAVSSETVIDEYNDVVENYFKAITTRKEKP